MDIASKSLDKLKNIPGLTQSIHMLQLDLIEQFPIISRLLDDVAKVHPFVSGECPCNVIGFLDLKGCCIILQWLW